MSLEKVNGEVVHYPKRRDLFQFDSEVASIFDDMAPRSIPMYNEVHRVHVSMFKHLLKPGAVVADIGSSTGHLFRNIEREMGQTLDQAQITAIAVDISDAMMGRLQEEFPTAITIVGDIAEMGPTPPLLRADIIFCLYTLQFIPDERKLAAAQWLVSTLRPGGVLVLGQKELLPSLGMDDTFSQEYYKFRRDNGYTQAEIDAKTAALKGSMFPITAEALRTMLATCGLVCVETSRWLMFSTVACMKEE